MSLLFVWLEYKVQGDWPSLLELPGFLVAMFTVGVHGPMKPFHVVMVVVDAVCYGAIVFAAYGAFFGSTGKKSRGSTLR